MFRVLGLGFRVAKLFSTPAVTRGIMLAQDDLATCRRYSF